MKKIKKFPLKKLSSFLQKKSFLLYTAIVLVIVFFSAFYIYPMLRKDTANAKSNYKGVLQIWNIDSFEGGKGSRTSFLQGIGKQFEQGQQGLFVLVTTHTIGSAKAALQRGERPDLISYGTGCDFVADIAQPIDNFSYRAATLHGKCYGYPWAVGQYMLLSFEENFDNVQPENTVLSSNAESLTTVAAASFGLHGNYALQESTTAYSNFVNKKYRYLLGTQRDVARLMSRNLPFYTKPIQSFSNLQQYISITATDRERKKLAQAYIELLLSAKVQEKLQQIGMMSLTNAIYTAENPLQQIEKSRPQYTISPFLSGQSLAELKSLAMQAINTDKNQAQNLQKFYILYL